ncbi:hypothetical protein JZ751_020605 [Albula glossodonta]|uniref:RNA polymerase II subunit M n=1 Tax=Albula glossodonta TaxID=121402 RepID=A0A8T2PMY3_9TELE|nr:hypothetical protein JZ751_020605 [Albula glossodonta]
MSSSWTERQGHIGDLQSKSKVELCEILSRQEKLLSNKKFIQSLPDKGRKISDFVERVRLALAHHEEEEKKCDMLSAVRAEFQSKYQQALCQRKPGHCADTLGMAVSETPRKDWQDTVPPNGSVDQLDSFSKAPQAQGHVNADECKDYASSSVSAVVSMETVASDAGKGISVTHNRTVDGDLADALGKVSLSNDSIGSSRVPVAMSSDGAEDGLCQSKQLQKKPHYIEVLEKAEMTTAMRRPKFKPNQPAHRPDGSLSGSSSPSRSPGGAQQLSADARRQRDRKHLDDITAAKLPLLHHSPAQLLSLEESAALQREQTRKYEELQAKMAAQKLSERLGVSMASYSPEGGQMGRYREVHDDGTQPSSDEG